MTSNLKYAHSTNTTVPTKMFSVVIPTYNSERYIVECIESVLSQSCQEFEIIVVDNNSSDSTRALVNQFNSEKIKLFQIENNGVIAASRNYGMSKAAGEYIAFLDSDDKWYVNKLEECSKYLEKHDFVCHNMDGIHRRNPIFGAKELSFYRLFLRGNCVATSSVIISKDLICKLGGFSEDCDLITVEDYDLWLKLLWSGVNLYSVDQLLGFYRKHDSNSSNYKSYANAMRKLIDHWANRLPKFFVIARRILTRYELWKMAPPPH